MDTVQIHIIRERVDENGQPLLNPYTHQPLINGGAVLLPNAVKAFPGEVVEVAREVADGLIRDSPQMVELESTHRDRMRRIRENQQRHNQNRYDVQQAMHGSDKEREARAKMEALIAKRDRELAERRDSLLRSQEVEKTKQAEIEKLSASTAVLLAKLEERERKDAESAARLAQLQAELEETKARLANSEKPRAKLAHPDKPKPEPEKPTEPKPDESRKG